MRTSAPTASSQTRAAAAQTRLKSRGSLLLRWITRRGVRAAAKGLSANRRPSLDWDFGPLLGAAVKAIQHLLHHQPVLPGHLVRPAVAADFHEVPDLVFEVRPLADVGGGGVDHVA